jgi:hypothetical protein
MGVYVYGGFLKVVDKVEEQIIPTNMASYRNVLFFLGVVVLGLIYFSISFLSLTNTLGKEENL